MLLDHDDRSMTSTMRRGGDVDRRCGGRSADAGSRLAQSDLLRPGFASPSPTAPCLPSPNANAACRRDLLKASRGAHPSCPPWLTADKLCCPGAWRRQIEDASLPRVNSSIAMD